MVGFRDKSYFSAGPVEGTYWFTPSDDETLPTKFIFGGGDRFSSRGAWAAGSNNLPMITAATNVSPLFIFGNAAGATNATVAVSNLFIKGTGYPLPTSGELRFNYGSRIQWGTTGGALGGYIQDANNNLKLGLEVPPYLFMDLNSTRLNLYSNFVSGAQIQSTNKFVANTYAMVDGSRTTAGNVFEYKTNNSTVFNVDTTGAVGATRFTGQFRGAWYANNNANAGWDLLSSSPPWLKTVDPGGSPTPSILSSNGLFSGWVGITNSGIYLAQLTAPPAKAILASAANNTPWTAWNQTNLGPVLGKTNSTSSAGGFTIHRIAVDSEYLAQLKDEFFGGGNASFQIGELGWRNISGGNGTPGAIASEANHPGIFRASTAGSANSYSGFALSQSTSQSGSILTDGDGAWTFIFRPSSTNNTDTAVGFAPPATHFIATASPNTLAWNTANICVVSTNGSPWYLHARNAAGGPESWVSTGVASQSADWVKAKFRWDSANSIMYLSVNDSAEVSASGASLPALSALRSPVFQIITSDTNARDIDADFFWAKQVVTR